MKNKKFYFGVLAVVVVIFVYVITTVNHWENKKTCKNRHFYDVEEIKQDTVVRFAFKDTMEFICRIYPLETMTIWGTNRVDEPYIVSYPKKSAVVALDSDWGIFENNDVLMAVVIDRKIYDDKELAAIENSVKALLEKYKSLKVDFPEKITDAEFRQEMLSASYADLMDRAGYSFIAEMVEIQYNWYTR
ncbi:MAG: hypothetical protein J6L86_04815 [Alphaproteobacteria bacterium]|nr:hypothetical protein [Alphaproteobacteria bacterium]